MSAKIVFNGTNFHTPFHCEPPDLLCTKGSVKKLGTNDFKLCWWQLTGWTIQSELHEVHMARS
uniref:Uncharacterized protein n=1 Tax=Anguilla anguilla TaxID=7936 RepID=A0A0E9SJX9_ANGAN